MRGGGGRPEILQEFFPKEGGSIVGRFLNSCAWGSNRFQKMAKAERGQFAKLGACFHWSFSFFFDRKKMAEKVLWCFWRGIFFGGHLSFLVGSLCAPQCFVRRRG